MKKTPLISIVTVVFNGAKTIEESIQSVLNQSYKNVEYIIVDGGSTDGTLDIIKKYEESIAYWVSEEDGGIYDAMNKGIQASKGDTIGIVNADDVLYLDTLERVQSLMLSKDLDYTYGTVHYMNENGVVFGEMSPMPTKDIERQKYYDMPFPHPSMFVKREVYEKTGLYKLEFRLSADYDFVLRVLEAGYRGLALSEPTGKFRSGGESGGFETFIDTKNVLLGYKVSKVLVYKNMLTSMAKVLLLKYFPNIASKIRAKLRKKSRHSVYEKEEK